MHIVDIIRRQGGDVRIEGGALRVLGASPEQVAAVRDQAAAVASRLREECGRWHGSAAYWAIDGIGRAAAAAASAPIFARQELLSLLCRLDDAGWAGTFEDERRRIGKRAMELFRIVEPYIPMSGTALHESVKRNFVRPEIAPTFAPKASAPKGFNPQPITQGGLF